MRSRTSPTPAFVRQVIRTAITARLPLGILGCTDLPLIVELKFTPDSLCR